MPLHPKIYRLEGVIQHYSWGGDSFLPEFLKKKDAGQKPFAEYWMGAHTNAPSLVLLDDGNKVALDVFIAQNPTAVLGEAVVASFGTLPYLFKVLDVKDMLSIQVHPSREAAIMEFEAENKKGIPLNAGDRNYKDDNHKPELMYALGDFWLLHGFKPPAAMESVLNNVPELNFLVPVWHRSGYEGVYRTVMEMPQEEVNQRLQTLIDRVVPLYKQKSLTKQSEDFWAARAYHTFCKEGLTDRGLFSIYLFNVVALKKGEAIFQDAGIPHAYLEGQNLELMANSDNVLRGGLTNKKVDVPELLKHVRFEPTIPSVVTPSRSAGSVEQSYKTAARDFELRQINVGEKEQLTTHCHTADIFLVTDGELTLTEAASKLELAQGDTVLAVNGAHLNWKAGNKAATVFRATVP